MPEKAVQDYYPEEFAHCYGCGRLNTDGMQIKSFWNGKECICRFSPKPFYTGGFPGNAYGGLISSLIDCHAAATASAAKMQADGFSVGEKPAYRFVTAALKVDYLKPTPLDTVLTLSAKPVEMSNRKVIVSVLLSANDTVCATGECIMVLMPDEPK